MKATRHKTSTQERVQAPNSLQPPDSVASPPSRTISSTCAESRNKNKHESINQPATDDINRHHLQMAITKWHQLTVVMKRNAKQQ
uniref:Uncharacterized protein n=1 Tax=Ascaris lumbricoides TaxID=6252 RepID=A0A0M3I0U0_ASCLU